jgi:hypothetical protein
MTLCSAVMLIDLAKCGHLRLDENYSKYFLDIDYGLSVWEAGYEVVCTPHAEVTHIGGATLEQGSRDAHALHEPQRRYFVEKWMKTGRYDALEAGIWARTPEYPRWQREGAVDAALPVVESYRAHSIVVHDGVWYGVSEGYRSLTKGRIERRGYLRLASASSLEEMKRQLDRMPYPTLLLHARIAGSGGRATVRKLYLAASGFGRRVLRAFGYRTQRAAGKGTRFAARMLQRFGWARDATPGKRAGKP